MTMTNAEWMIKHGYKFSDIYAYGEYNNDGDFIWHIQLLKGDIDEISSKHNYANVITAWLDAEHKEPILDDVEKRYLAGVIRPFRNDMQYIVKSGGTLSDCTYEEISVWYQDKFRGYERNIMFPRFETGTMYKGMKAGRRYTLEELGL